MCAIMGILEKASPVNESVLQNMQTILHHRGPDDTGWELYGAGTEEHGSMARCDLPGG